MNNYNSIKENPVLYILIHIKCVLPMSSYFESWANESQNFDTSDSKNPPVFFESDVSKFSDSFAKLGDSLYLPGFSFMPSMNVPLSQVCCQWVVTRKVIFEWYNQIYKMLSKKWCVLLARWAHLISSTILVELDQFWLHFSLSH